MAMAALNTQPIIPNDLAGQVARELKLKKDSVKNKKYNRQVANLQKKLSSIAQDLNSESENGKKAGARQLREENATTSAEDTEAETPQPQAQQAPGAKNKKKNIPPKDARQAAGQAKKSAPGNQAQAPEGSKTTPANQNNNIPAETLLGQKQPQQPENLEADTLQKAPQPEEAEENAAAEPETEPEEEENEENTAPYQPLTQDEEGAEGETKKEEKEKQDEEPETPEQAPMQKETPAEGQPAPTERQGAAEEITEKIESEEEEKEAERDLSREQRLAAIAEKKEEEKEGKGEESQGAEAAKSPLDIGWQLASAKALIWSWTTFYYVLPLLYTNFHFIGKYIAYSNWFCKFGEEVTITKKATSQMAAQVLGEKNENNPMAGILAAGSEWLEIIALFTLDLIISLIIGGFIYLVYYVLEHYSWITHIL
ncbi:MAG: hypothetical protein NTZ49_02630 [Candidatus Parcubacteria bacterium]|nr:hypothetical protein [Candidatus Parcubacteria bacterium]